MHDVQGFGLATFLVALAGLAAILSNRLTARIRVPAPALVLVVTAVLVKVVPDLHAPSGLTVERLVSVALILILFDGGLHIGARRFRRAAGPIAVVGVLGTFLTVALAAVALRYLFGIEWYLAVLVATAIAPTDPAVVFSVLGNREVRGRSGTILEGESGANDPVGIALMASLIAAGELSGHAFADVGVQFVVQMVIGAAIGWLGGRATVWFIRRVPLPAEGLYPLRTLACAAVVFGVTTVAHGSGFLAVFVAGIVLGDVRAPFKREIERFHSAVASLGEIVAFVVLGLTVDLAQLARTDVWVPGVVVGALLAFVIRPLCVGLCLVPVRLRPNERAFVLLAGLKGAVPILLGTSLLAAHVAHADRLYGIVVVVVVFSVVVQGSAVPTLTARLRLPTRTVEPEPWALGVRVRAEPEGVHHVVVAPGSRADGHTVGELVSLPEDVWVSVIVRDHRLLRVRDDTTLAAGDQVMVLADGALSDVVRHTFEGGDEVGR